MKLSKAAVSRGFRPLHFVAVAAARTDANIMPGRAGSVALSKASLDPLVSPVARAPFTVCPPCRGAIYTAASLYI